MTLKTDFAKDLGLDSLDQIELLVAVENEFGLTNKNETSNIEQTFSFSDGNS